MLLVSDMRKGGSLRSKVPADLFDNHIIPCLAWPPVKPEIVAGAVHTCVLKSDGEMTCFGRTAFGRIDVPPDLGPVKAVAAGGVTHAR